MTTYVSIDDRAGDWERYRHGDDGDHLDCTDDVCLFVRSLLGEIAELQTLVPLARV